MCQTRRKEISNGMNMRHATLLVLAFVFSLGIKAQVLYVNPDRDLIMVRVGQTTMEPAFVPELFEELANVWPE